MPKAKFLALVFFFIIIIILLTLKANAEEEKTDLFAKEISVLNDKKNVNITVEIENNGTQVANGIFVKFLEVGNETTFIGEIFIDTINAKKNATAFIEYKPEKFGDKKIIAIIDYAKDMDETNNIIEKVLEIKEEEIAHSELVLKKLKVENEKISVVIENFGETAENFDVRFIDCFYYKDKLNKKEIAKIRIEKLLSNTSVELTTKWNQYMIGYHKIIAIADSEHLIKEKNTTNNILEIVLNLTHSNNIIYMRNTNVQAAYEKKEEIAVEMIIERKNDNFGLPVYGILTISVFDAKNNVVVFQSKNFYIAYKNSKVKMIFFFNIAKEGKYSAKINMVYFGFADEKNFSFEIKEKEKIIVNAENKINFTSILIYSTIGFLSVMFAFSNTEIGKLKFLLLFIPLWVRTNKEESQNNFKRGGIYYYIIANPGAHFSEIRDTLNLANGELAYHLKVLEDTGQINSMNDGIRKRFYPKNVERREPILTKIQREIFNLVKSKPGINQNEIANNLHKSKQVVSYHIQIMNEMNVVKVERDKKTTRCFAMI